MKPKQQLTVTPDEYRKLLTPRSPKGRVHALGRLKPGTMNRTESAYAQHLELRRRAGEVAWYRFEAITLRLAERTTYTPDFFVMLADGQLECHEVKGAKAIFRDDARVKLRLSADAFPFGFVVVYPRDRKLSAWEFEWFTE